MNVVIGSGPAGMACTYGLLAKGESVLVVDAGVELEQRQRDLLSKVREGQNGDAFRQLKNLQSHIKITSKGIGTKLIHGSDFPYRGASENLGLDISETGLLPSLAIGGFSNVWGASILPYPQEDIQDWPIAAKDLARHYEAVVKITGLSAKRDDLAYLFPLFTETPNNLEPSSQANRILQGLGRIKDDLKQNGISYGSSRLAIGPNLNNSQPCVYCGQCIYGCPYGCIYNSGDDLAGLIAKKTPGLQFKSNVIVEEIKEAGSVVSLHGYDRVSKAPIKIEAERAFLAAGVIPSSRIILKSLGIYDKPVLLNDSQYFLFPMLSIRGDGEAVREALYTLSQIFVEIQDKDLSPHTVHLQLYTYNDIITKTMREKLWFLPGLRNLLVSHLQHRMIIVQGYLHSCHSGKVSLSLNRDPSTSKERLAVNGIPEVQVKKIIHKVIKKIGKHFRKLGLFPLMPALEICSPGRSFHSGSSFPMKLQPGPLESDIYGRVGGASRIHVVDASTFPSIPATTITLTAMANAHRIASENY